MDMAIQHLKHCSITNGDILAADDIYRHNLGSLKGKMVSCPNPHVMAGLDPVPPDILKTHQSITSAINIMFMNKVPFLITMSHNIHFSTVEALPNRQVLTIIEKLKGVAHLYKHCRFNISMILADPEFKPIHGKFPFLYCMSLRLNGISILSKTMPEAPTTCYLPDRSHWSFSYIL